MKTLDYFFQFLNFDLEQLDFDNLGIPSMAYVRFAFENTDANPKGRYDALTSSAFSKSETEFEKAKQFLWTIQKHLREVVNGIIDSDDNAGFIFSQKGERRIYIKDGEFRELFQVPLPPIEDFDFKVERPFIDALFGDMVINEKLNPGQFNRCNECGDYFYQKTKRETKFCSTRCSNNNRQKRFQKNKGTTTQQELDNAMNRSMAEMKRKKKISQSH